ncbi:MAG: FGGY-family carbohydrate kinase [Natronohydrobacter sp.]|nr:FGGY-family carbohydrate kinase [Natronohydrobacter sp.]
MADLYLGIDLGTSGARASVIDAHARRLAEAKSALAEHGADHRDPAIWWAAVTTALHAVLAQIDARQVKALAVDATSGTMLGLDANWQPMGNGIMYNDPCADTELLATITAASPAQTAARGPSSALARAIVLARAGACRVVHQADWIAMQLGAPWVSDANNALKTGYDPVTEVWPDWVLSLASGDILPPVVAPGTPVGPVGLTPFGLPPDCLIVAGTTDGCASFLATGAEEPGEGVTALGTTMTIKLLSDQPIFAPEYGIYSHRILGKWLAGGASNTGGAVILRELPGADLTALSARIDPSVSTGLDYYPLPSPGERFPVNDASLMPRLGPRPAADHRHLQAIFEGLASVEHLAYRRLAELGGPVLRSVRSVGGGAENPVLAAIRAQRLNVSMPASLSSEAAFGAALLARAGSVADG